MAGSRYEGRRRGRPTPIAHVLTTVYPDPREWPTIRAFAAWSRGLPARVVANARPVRLLRGTLYVNVTSPVWAQELSFLEPGILERIRKMPGAATVRSIKFRVGELPEAIPLEMPPNPTIGPLPPPPADPVLEAALSTIANDELRKAVAKAAASSLARNERRPRKPISG